MVVESWDATGDRVDFGCMDGAKTTPSSPSTRYLERPLTQPAAARSLAPPTLSASPASARFLAPSESAAQPPPACFPAASQHPSSSLPPSLAARFRRACRSRSASRTSGRTLPERVTISPGGPSSTRTSRTRSPTRSPSALGPSPQAPLALFALHGTGRAAADRARRSFRLVADSRLTGYLRPTSTFTNT